MRPGSCRDPCFGALYGRSGLRAPRLRDGGGPFSRCGASGGNRRLFNFLLRLHSHPCLLDADFRQTEERVSFLPPSELCKLRKPLGACQDAAMTAQAGFEVNRLRLVVGEKTLLGAIVMGDQKLSFPLEKIISGNMDITPIRASLLAPNAKADDIITTFWANRIKES